MEPSKTTKNVGLFQHVFFTHGAQANCKGMDGGKTKKVTVNWQYFKDLFGKFFLETSSFLCELLQ